MSASSPIPQPVEAAPSRTAQAVRCRRLRPGEAPGATRIRVDGPRGTLELTRPQEAAQTVYTLHLRPGTVAQLLDPQSAFYMRAACGLEVGEPGSVDVVWSAETLLASAAQPVDFERVCPTCLELVQESAR